MGIALCLIIATSYAAVPMNKAGLGTVSSVARLKR